MRATSSSAGSASSLTRSGQCTEPGKASATLLGLEIVRAGGLVEWAAGRTSGVGARCFDYDPPALARAGAGDLGADGYTDPGLSAFRARGGRLILKENMSDDAQSPYAGIQYHRSVVARMGQPAADALIRLYAAPGRNHSGGR